MLGTFLDKATSLLDRGFLVAYWFPVFIASVISVLIRIYVCGQKVALGWWQQEWMKAQYGGFSAQILFIVGGLILITIIAYILQPSTSTMIHFYEGYWPPSLQKWLINLPLFGEKNIWKEKTDHLDAAVSNKNSQKYSKLHTQLFYGYPKENRLMPTRLGNTLRAAEDYSRITYGMDSVFWWPRLWPLLSDVVRNGINESLISIVALLNFATLIMITALFGSLQLIKGGSDWEICLKLLIIGLILAFISYRAAVAQARVYGEKIRVAIDLYRFDLLKALHQQQPKNLNEETGVWKKLYTWLFTGDRTSIANMKYTE